MKKAQIFFIAVSFLFAFPFNTTAQKAKSTTATTKLATTAQIAAWVRKTGKTTVGHRDFRDPDKVVTSKYIFFTAGKWQYCVAAILEPADSPCVRIARCTQTNQKDLIVLVDSDGDNAVDMRFGGQTTTIANVEELWQEYLAAVSARIPAKFKTAPP
jgi:hypothetical protein